MDKDSWSPLKIMDLSPGTCRKEGEGYSYHEYDNPHLRHGVCAQKNGRVDEIEKYRLLWSSAKV